MEGGNYSPFFYSSSSGEGRGELWHLFLIIVWGRVFIIFYLRWSVGVAFLTRISIYHQVNAKRKNIEYIKLLWHVSEYIAAIWTDNFDIVPGKFRYDGSMQRPLVFVARSYLQDTMRYIAVRNSNTGTSLVTYCLARLRLVDFNSSYQILNFVASDSVLWINQALVAEIWESSLQIDFGYFILYLVVLSIFVRGRIWILWSSNYYLLYGVWIFTVIKTWTKVIKFPLLIDWLNGAGLSAHDPSVTTNGGEWTWFVIELAKNFGLICTFFSRQSWKTQWWTSAMSLSSVLKFVMLSALWPIYCALLRKSIF